MRWKRIHNYEYTEDLKELGCPMPNSPEYYSYGLGDAGFIREQPCVDLFTSLKPSAVKKYRMVQHYSIGSACDEGAVLVLCRRELLNKHKTIVTMHPIGECPLCKYHTVEEFYEEFAERHGMSAADTRMKMREARIT